MHAVSLTPHAQKNVQTTLFSFLKVKSICKTAMVCKKIINACGVNDTACTVHAVALTPHARCMQCH
jgi:hypothetical protein